MAQDDESSSEAPDKSTQAPRRLQWRPLLAGAALAYLIIFAVENTTTTKVHWVFFTSENALITVIVVSGLLGVLIGQLVGLMVRRRKKASGKA